MTERRYKLEKTFKKGEVTYRVYDTVTQKRLSMNEILDLINEREEMYRALYGEIK